MQHRLMIALTMLLIAAPFSARAQRAVYIVRHAENAGEELTAPLTTEGEKRARSLARLLKGARIEAVYTSNYKRTQDTSQPLARARGLMFVPIEDGDPRKTFDAIRKDHPEDNVLVVGHSGPDSVPALVKLWAPDADVSVGITEYNKIFVVVPKPGTTAAWTMFRYAIDEP